MLGNDFPGEVVGIVVARSEIGQVRIGSPFIWALDEYGRATRSDALARAYHVDGLPDNMEADLVPGGPLGAWTFVVRFGGRTVKSKWSCKSKEHALEDLRNWLLDQDFEPGER